MSDIHTAYCAACDRHVPVTIVDAHGLGDVTRVLCLVSPDRCTGAFCLFQPASQPDTGFEHSLDEPTGARAAATV